MAIELAGHPIAKCRSCGAMILWLKTASGKNMPVDAASVQQGDASTIYNASLGHISHFATCPDANKHRSKPVGVHGNVKKQYEHARMIDHTPSHEERYSANGGTASETIEVQDDERDYG